MSLPAFFPAPCSAAASTPRRFLVWSLAFGPRGRRLAAIWADALFRVGGWRHDAVLLSDRPDGFAVAPRLRVIDIHADVCVRHGLPAAEWTHWTLNNLKAQVAHYVPLESYDYILYLDIDVLVNRPWLEALVEAHWRKGRVTVQEDCMPLAPGKLRALAKLGLPNRTEFAQWARRPICAGVIGFPTTRLGLDVLADYAEACAAMRFALSDQAKLTALLHRRYPHAWDYFGDTVHGRRVAPRYPETLVHFTGQRDAQLATYHALNLQDCAAGRALWLRLRAVVEQWNYQRKRQARARAYWQGASYQSE